MQEDWWESPVCWLCDYWWALLAALVLGLTAYITRDLWLPLLGLEPSVPELGTGDVQATLTWDTTDDLDLWVTDPQGVSIFFSSPTSPSGGQLDVDANAGCTGNITDHPIENIFWSAGVAPLGQYKVEVHYYERCVSDTPVSFHVRLLVDGQVSEYDGVVETEDDREIVDVFER
jgi:hypothetical protein